MSPMIYLEAFSMLLQEDDLSHDLTELQRKIKGKAEASEMPNVKQITKEKEIPEGGAPGTYAGAPFSMLLNTKCTCMEETQQAGRFQ